MQNLGQEGKMTWLEAESWCQQNKGHLASYATVDERVSAHIYQIINY